MAGSTMLDVAGELSQEVIRQPRPEGREGPACRVAQAIPGRGGSMGNLGPRQTQGGHGRAA